MKQSIQKTIKKVNVFGIVALFVAGGMAIAFTPTTNNNVKWSLKENSIYEKVEGGYLCLSGSTICTRTYPADQNPNLDDSNPISQEDGIFNALP